MRARLSLLLLALCSLPCAAEDPTLSADDEKLLQGLLGKLLFDPPADARRVEMTTTVRTCWGSEQEVPRQGWLLPAGKETPAQVVFTDGRTVKAPSPDQLRSIDLVESCKARLDAQGAESDEDRWRRGAMSGMRGEAVESELALAAWLLRRGEKGLAARMLAEARKGQRDAKVALEEALAADLAWECFAGLVHAYMVRADEEALGYGKRLVERHPELAKQYGQAATLVAELERRKEKGTFGKEPATEWPEGWDALAPERKAAFLIDALEEVDARQFSQPGGVELSSDRRVQELIRVGDAALPAVIEAIEKDQRLTRSVHFWRDFSRDRTVLSVAEAALSAATAITRVKLFERRSTGDNFTKNPDERARVAKELRAYWEANKGLTIEQRMRRTLVDPAATGEALREAAQNLARLGGKESPALKLADPTAAEAMLAAMDRDLAALGKEQQPDPRRPWPSGDARARVENHWFECLMALGDRRILPVALERAAAAKEMRARRLWGHLCHTLGDPAPLEAFMKAYAAGELELPPFDQAAQDYGSQPGAEELEACIETFVRAGGPAADAALRAPVAAGHPYHAAVAALISRRDHGGWDMSGFFGHPWFIAFLRPQLDDTATTGRTWRREGDSLHYDGPNGSGSQSGGELDPAEWGDKADERRCDRAAQRVGMSVVGFPSCHALHRDRDERLARLREACDRYLSSLRTLTPGEANALEMREGPWAVRFIPGVLLRGRAATKEDVASGRAIFELGGESKPIDLPLPASARLAVGTGFVPALVVQAEELPSGERRYGVISAQLIDSVGPDRLEDLAPLPDPEAQAAAARTFFKLVAAKKDQEVAAMIGPDVLEQIDGHGGMGEFLRQVREALSQAGEDRLVEALAPGFRAGADGKWRLERLP